MSRDQLAGAPEGAPAPAATSNAKSIKREGQPDFLYWGCCESRYGPVCGHREGLTENRLVILAAANEVYLFDHGDWRIEHQETVMDVVYCGSEVVHQVVLAERWEQIRVELDELDDPIEIIDCRNGADPR